MTHLGRKGLHERQNLPDRTIVEFTQRRIEGWTMQRSRPEFAKEVGISDTGRVIHEPDNEISESLRHRLATGRRQRRKLAQEIRQRFLDQSRKQRILRGKVIIEVSNVNPACPWRTSTVSAALRMAALVALPVS